MERYHLFLMKIERPAQLSLALNGNNSNESLIKAGIRNFEIVEVRKKHLWAIGNFSEISGTEFFFNFGRISKSRAQDYNAETRNFENVWQTDIKLARVFVDVESQVFGIGISGNPQPSAKVIASYLCTVMKEAQKLTPMNVRLHLAPQQNPETFLKQIESATSIKNVSFHLTTPNPDLFEPDEFVEPAKKFIKKLNGSEMKVTTTGDQLETQNIRKIAENVSQYGDKISARITNKNGTPETISNQSSSLIISITPLRENASEADKLSWERESMNKIKDASKGTTQDT